MGVAGILDDILKVVRREAPLICVHKPDGTSMTVPITKEMDQTPSRPIVSIFL